MDDAALNAVDTSSEGEFLIPISATDSHGKRSEAVGKVIVVSSQEQEPPVEQEPPLEENLPSDEMNVVNETSVVEIQAIPSESVELSTDSDQPIVEDPVPGELVIEKNDDLPSKSNIGSEQIAEDF